MFSFPIVSGVTMSVTSNSAVAAAVSQVTVR